MVNSPTADGGHVAHVDAHVKLVGEPLPPLALASRCDALALMRREFPLTFTSPPAMLRPLALGIRGELFARLSDRFRTNGRDRFLLNQALACWCGSAAYLSVLAAGGHRADLDGNDVEAISGEHVADAARRLAERVGVPRPKSTDAARNNAKGAASDKGGKRHKTKTAAPRVEKKRSREVSTPKESTSGTSPESASAVAHAAHSCRPVLHLRRRTVGKGGTA